MGSTACQRLANFEPKPGVAASDDRHFAVQVDLGNERLYIGVLPGIVGYSCVYHCDVIDRLDAARAIVSRRDVKSGLPRSPCCCAVTRIASLTTCANYRTSCAYAFRSRLTWPLHIAVEAHGLHHHGLDFPAQPGLIISCCCCRRNQALLHRNRHGSSNSSSLLMECTHSRNMASV